MNTAVTSLPLNVSAQPSTSGRTGQRGWLARASAALWHALEESGRARAERHLRDFADQCEALQPELAKELRAASRGDART